MPFNPILIVVFLLLIAFVSIVFGVFIIIKPIDHGSSLALCLLDKALGIIVGLIFTVTGIAGAFALVRAIVVH